MFRQRRWTEFQFVWSQAVLPRQRLQLCLISSSTPSAQIKLHIAIARNCHGANNIFQAAIGPNGLGKPIKLQWAGRACLAKLQRTVCNRKDIQNAGRMPQSVLGGLCGCNPRRRCRNVTALRKTLPLHLLGQAVDWPGTSVIPEVTAFKIFRVESKQSSSRACDFPSRNQRPDIVSDIEIRLKMKSGSLQFRSNSCQRTFSQIPVELPG